MPVEIKRRAGPVMGGELVEIVTPRTNTASLTAAENFLAAAGTDKPFSLEIAATPALRVFLVRAAHPCGGDWRPSWAAPTLRRR